MQFKTCLTDLGRVDSDDKKFWIKTPRDCTLLALSIKNIGLVNLPVLQEKANGKFRIICGFSRIAACHVLEMSQVEARIIDSRVSDQKCACLAISENASQGPLNLLEQSRAISMLGPDLPVKERLPIIKKTLFLPENQNQRYLEQIESLCKMIEPIQAGIESGAIAFAMALKLDKLEQDHAKAFARLFKRLFLSLGKQRDVLTLVKEIAAREEMSISDVLNCPDIIDILEHEKTDTNQKARNIRLYLKKRRFPNLTLAKEVYDQEIKGLELPQGVRLEAPPHFEGTIYELKISFKDIDSLIKNKDIIKKITEKPEIRKILSRS